MKLRTLLLGSTAAIFASGAATTASAADATGLVVATMQSNAAYVPLCNGDDGFQLNGWCFVPTGEVEWTARWGFQHTRTFGALPNNAANLDEPTTITRAAPSNVQYNLTRVFELEVDNGYTEFVLNIIEGTLELEIGAFVFTNAGITWSPSIGDVDFDIRLRETDTLGWRDALRGDLGTANPATGDNLNTRNWTGGLHIPDVELAVDFGAIDFAVNGGYRRIRTPATPYVVTPLSGVAFTTIGGEMNFDFDIGDAITLTGGADFDRVMTPSAFAIAGNAVPPGDDTVSYTMMWAWGANVGLEVDAGPVNLEVHGYFGRNFGGYTMYSYWYQPAGNYWALEANLGLEFGPVEFTLEGTMTDGPQTGNEAGAALGPLGDRLLLVEAGLAITPDNFDDVTINLAATLERQMYGTGYRRLWFAAGVEMEPADDVTVEFELTHFRPVAAWSGSPAVPGATNFQITTTVGF